MLTNFGATLEDWAKKYIPDAFIFALVLTLLTGILGIVLTDSSALNMLQHWQEGFWGLLEFAAQVSISLVAGYAIVMHPRVHGLVYRLAGVASSARLAVALVALVAVLSALVHWAFALVVPALLAREIGKRSYEQDIPIHYPLLGAAAYTGLLVWEGGLSGAIPLFNATPGHVLEEEIGVIPVATTLLSPLNLVLTGGMVILVPLILVLMVPRDPTKLVPVSDQVLGDEEREVTTDEAAETSESVEAKSPDDPQHDSRIAVADRLEQSKVLGALIGLMGLAYIVYYFATSGFALNFNFNNLVLLTAGILLYRSPLKYFNAFQQGVTPAAGVLLAFPFYAGIMGMINLSGLSELFVNWFVGLSTQFTFPLFAFLSAAVVNFFVPSGGGQWAVQGPLMIEAGTNLGVSVPKTIMSVAYGDQLTNMATPFWAIPLLGIMGLRARDIIGYTIALMIIIGIFNGAAILFLPA